MKKSLSASGTAMMVIVLLSLGSPSAIADPGNGNSGAVAACKTLADLGILGALEVNHGECVRFFRTGKFPNNWIFS